MTSQVRLISYTQSLDNQTHTISDQICYVARVSNPSKQSNTFTNDRLIRYLLKNKHFSPFEMVNVCLEINTTRDISRQILRHRSMSFQEFSQRYADPTDYLAFEVRETRIQDTNNRQNSLVCVDIDLIDEFKSMQEELIEKSKELYKLAISKGIAKEQARVLLPEGLTRTRMYINGTLRSWLHYIEVRTDPTTQKEHREIALACANEIAKIFPDIMQFVHSEEKL